jgi:hypothetical protein
VSRILEVSPGLKARGREEAGTGCHEFVRRLATVASCEALWLEHRGERWAPRMSVRHTAWRRTVLAFVAIISATWLTSWMSSVFALR